MAEEKKPDLRIWGYSKDGAKIFADGKLPAGYYANPAMVPGSEAEKLYKKDAERDGAKVPWETEENPPQDPKLDPKPEQPAPAPKPTLTLPEAKK